MSIDQLVRQINPQHKLRLSFHATPYEVGQAEYRFSNFFGCVVRDLDGTTEFFKKINTIVRELAESSLRLPTPERLWMESHIGPQGVAIAYRENYNGNGSVPHVVDLAKQDLEMAKNEFDSGKCLIEVPRFVKIYKLSDHVVLEHESKKVICVKYGHLNVAMPEKKRALQNSYA
jgi:hypothetical protein